MYHTKKFLIILALYSTSINAGSSQFEGCVGLSSDGTCGECYKRKLLPNGQGCGPKQPDSDPCEFYDYSKLFNKTNCIGCKPGYSNKEQVIGDQFVTGCIKGVIPDCLYESYIPVGPTPGHFCNACGNKKYAFFNKTSQSTTCANFSNPVANCKWGSYVTFGIASCFLCEDGFTLKLESHTCIPAVQEGCWYSANGKCLGCNSFSGYSIGKDGKCFKSGQNSTQV